MQKNKFLTFLFALIPGCGHMYLGYMKRGVEFMAMFVVSGYLAIMSMNFYNFDIIGILFALILPVIWFYQMFDSMHIVSLMKKFEVDFPADDGFFIPGFSNVSNTDSLNFFFFFLIIKGFAAVFIFVGAYVLLITTSVNIGDLLRNNSFTERSEQIYRFFRSVMRTYIPSAVISVLLILAGLRLLKGNGKNNNENGGE
jgi:hypothetical protein